MTERLHWSDHAGAICGRAHPINPKYARTVQEITCRSCAKKLGVMLSVTREFVEEVRKATRDE